MSFLRILAFLIIGTSCTVNNETECFPGFEFKNFRGTLAEDLSQAVWEEDTTEIKRLVQQKNIYVDFQEPFYKRSLLQLAVVNNLYFSTKTLLELGANPNLVDTFDCSAVLNCVFKKDFECKPDFLELLLLHGGDPNQIAKYPINSSDSSVANTYVLMAPILQIVQSNCMDELDILLEYGGDVNLYTKHDGYGAISEAIMHDNLNMTHYLIIEKQAMIPNVCVIFGADTLGVIEFINLIDIEDTDTLNQRLKTEIIHFIESNK